MSTAKCHFVPPLGKPSFKRLFIKRSCHQPTHQQPWTKGGCKVSFLWYATDQIKWESRFFVRTSLPPVEGIFFDGQIFDAYAFATNLIKSAKNSLILIDNYIDENTLLMLSKRTTGVDATIYTQRITPQLQLDLTRHNNQYPPINIRTYRQAHDRFLL